MNRRKPTLWMMLIALFLAAFWLPASSHPLLESAGIIHHDDDGDGDHTMNHDAADGCCRVHSTHVVVKAPTLLAQVVPQILMTEVILLPHPVEASPGVIRIRGTSPPELSRRWQFAERAALPSRAPSLVA